MCFAIVVEGVLWTFYILGLAHETVLFAHKFRGAHTTKRAAAHTIPVYFARKFPVVQTKIPYSQLTYMSKNVDTKEISTLIHRMQFSNCYHSPTTIPPFLRSIHHAFCAHTH